MKILLPIGTLYPSQQGGPSNTIYWLAKALQRNGCEVTSIATDMGNPSDTVPSNTWLQTDYGKVIYTREWSHQIPFKLLWQAIKAIPDNDLVHLNSLFYPPSFLLALIALLRKKSIVWSCRGNLESAALEYSRWKKVPVLWLIRNFLVNDRVVFHATSPNEVKQIKIHLGATVQVVDIPNYLELPEVLTHMPATSPYFLYIGRIHPIKGLDQLLLALDRSLKFRNSAFVLKIAGDFNTACAAELKEQVKRLHLENKVEFIGLVEGYTKQRCIADAHFLILPSHSENFGNVVVEALAQGTPVITSKGTPWAILPTQNAGFWVENTPQMLADVIDKALVLSPDDYQKYRDNANRLVTEKFDINNRVEDWIDIYKKLIP